MNQGVSETTIHPERPQMARNTTTVPLRMISIPLR